MPTQRNYSTTVFLARFRRRRRSSHRLLTNDYMHTSQILDSQDGELAHGSRCKDDAQHGRSAQYSQHHLECVRTSAAASCVPECENLLPALQRNLIALMM